MKAILSLAILLSGGNVAWAQEPPAHRWSEDKIHEEVSVVRAGKKLKPREWPDGARLAVCLSFDVDNETLALRRGDTSPVELSAGEFGALEGLPRILALLDRQALPASFFIPAVSAILHPEMLTAIAASGRHEVAVHGWIHENLAQLDDAVEEERLLRSSIDRISGLIGRRPVGFRAPSWAFSRHTLELVRDAGFLYDSSLMAMDEPYEPLSGGEPTGLVELPVDWVLDDYPYFGPNASGSLPSPEIATRVYRDEFDRAYEDGTMLMLTFHPHVIGHRSRMAHLESLIAYMRSKPRVWFATAAEIAAYVKKQSRD